VDQHALPRPELQRRRPHPDRRRGPLPRRHDQPGAYPWGNHDNAWRPAHIHFSLFGPAFATRLVTQMYFPGDPLLAADPIFNCTADETARGRLVSAFDWETTLPGHALGYRFDMILSGPDATPMEARARARRHDLPDRRAVLLDRARLAAARRSRARRRRGERVGVSGRILDGDGQGVSDAVLELWQANADGRYAHPEDTQTKPVDPAFRGLRSRRHRRDRPLPVHDRQAGPRARPTRRDAGPAHRRLGLRARLDEALVTRLYFPDEAAMRPTTFLGLAPAARRSSLVAAQRPGGSLEWNVVLQGAGETVFFDC
jgi:protocatechuate 3,4-dioxygenase beta subunit